MKRLIDDEVEKRKDKSEKRERVNQRKVYKPSRYYFQRV